MLYKRNPQLNKNGELQHLLSIEGLPKSILNHILDTASSFVSISDREVKKVPLMRGKSVFNLFFENSTRTRTTFEIASKRLSADVINLNIQASSASKGESLLDTIDNLAAMHADMFVVRHAQSGAPYLIAQHLDKTGQKDIHVVNAGDGRHACPRCRLHRRRHAVGDALAPVLPAPRPGPGALPRPRGGRRLRGGTRAGARRDRAALRRALHARHRLIRVRSAPPDPSLRRRRTGLYRQPVTAAEGARR